MAMASVLKIVILGLALGVCCADLDIHKTEASPTLQDLASVETESGAQFHTHPVTFTPIVKDTSENKLQKPAFAPLPRLHKKANPPAQTPPTQTPLSTPETPTAVSGAPVVPTEVSGAPVVPTAVSGAPVITPTSTPMVMLAPPPKGVKDIFGKKGDKMEKDEENLVVPVYTYNFAKAAPPAKDTDKLDENATSKFSISGRKMI